MQINEKSKLGQDFEVIGKVQIDYTDSLTGKVRERISKNNHVFSNSFNTYGWWNWLNKTDEPILFITDNDTTPDDSFPYLRGNVIGYGTINAGTSGGLRGLYNADESILAADINNGMGRQWKYVYSFTGEQIPSAIKSIGITSQYANYGGYTLRMYRNKWHKYTALDRSTVARGDKLFSIADTGVVTVRNPFTEIDKSINLGAIVGSSGRNLSVGMADDTYKAYIIAYSSTAAQRQIYEFADETFSLLVNTYNWPALVSQPPRRIFVVYGDEVWFYQSGYKHGNFKNNEDPIVKTTMTKDGYNNYFISDWNSTNNGYGSVVSKNGKIYWSADCFSGSNMMTMPIWDMATDTMAAHFNPSRYYSTSSSYITQGQMMFDPTERDMLMLSSSYNGLWIPKQALTCFVQPADAPERPDGAGVKITYQLDVNY